jgi:hypothetical protein
MERFRRALVGLALLGAVVLGGVVVADPLADPREPAPEATELAFREVGSEVGFAYTNDVRFGIMSNAGVYAADYDDDGWTDLLAVGGNRSVLYENRRGTFAPSGELAGIDRTMRSALFLDYDDDGRTDLLLFPDGGQPLAFRNDGGNLERVDVGFDVNTSVPTGATAGDYTGNGCLDLFVVQNGDWTTRLPAGQRESGVTPRTDNGNPNYLFRGNCERFENVTAEAGIRGTRWSLAASTVDLDEDGRPDVHVANDFNHDVVYWNRGNGTFEQAVLGEATDRNGMASEIEDFDGDGRLDVFVTNIYFPPNASAETTFVTAERSKGNNLLLNRGDRTFADSAGAYGVRLGGWGWAAVATDLDNDGDTDVFHPTLSITAALGIEILAVRRNGSEYSYPALFERVADGQRPYRRRNASTAGFERMDGRGGAQLDFDHDGDVDIAVATAARPSTGTFRLYENVGATGEALQVRLVGGSATPIGARVAASTDDGTQVRAFTAKTDYLSQDAGVLHFGLGSHERADVRVTWPDGSRQTVENVSAGQRITLSRDGVEATTAFESGAGGGWCLRADCLGAPALALALAAVLGGVAVAFRRYDGRDRR